jgi:cytochrome oxidase Cu insertion factor (SCO1/SenC/PrrC family)
MRNRLQECLTLVALATIAMMVATSIGLPIGVAVAREIPNPDLTFKAPDETRLFGREVPDVGLRYADGGNGRLSDLWAERPVFVTLVFSRCAGICSPYLGLLNKTVEQVGSSGERYQMVVISFDLNDRPEDIMALAKFHGLEADPGWTFAVPASSEELTALCRSLDFDFRWDEQRRQFDHPAITVALRAGKFVRLSVGEEISPARFKDMLADAWGEFVPMYPTPGQRGALFRCFDYDPERGFTPNWGMLILIFPAVAALTLAALMFMAARVIRAVSSKAPAITRPTQE